MKKTAIKSIPRKNRIINNIIEALDTKQHFLMVGHANPDEDCTSSMVAFAVLAKMFDKEASICVVDEIHEQFSYLVDICRYNSIHMHGADDEPTTVPVDAVVICDTPKPEMVQLTETARVAFESDKVVKIEIDHHLEADSAYIGDEEYALVTEASSASELVGMIAMKLAKREDLLAAYHIDTLFPRNFVLAVLTGIIGDSKMGKFLKTKRERRFYEAFSGMFNELLSGMTNVATNYSTKEEVFDALGKLSKTEEDCFRFFYSRKAVSASVGYAVVAEEDIGDLYGEFDSDTVVAVSRSVADVLAEESQYVSLVAYIDNPDSSNLVQFRVRRSQAYRSLDLRDILDRFGVENGGGHEGAIGFRFDRSVVPDVRAYAEKLIEGIEDMIQEHPKATA